MKANQKLTDFVEWELDEFRCLCNFTPDELKFFDLRAKDYSLLQIQERLKFGSSKISNLSKSVKCKMCKVLPFKRPE